MIVSSTSSSTQIKPSTPIPCSASAAAPPPPPPPAVPAQFESKIESSILKSSEPIQINETQEISALGNRGIWANRCEVCTWKGDLPSKVHIFLIFRS
jgi:hypothetical protein